MSGTKYPSPENFHLFWQNELRKSNVENVNNFGSL